MNTMESLTDRTHSYNNPLHYRKTRRVRRKIDDDAFLKGLVDRPGPS